MESGQVLKLYNKLSQLPLGKKLFSILFSFKAPYFRTINASVNDLKPGTGSSLYTHVVLMC